MAETPGFGRPAHHVLALARSDAGTAGDAQEYDEHTRSAHAVLRARAVPAAEASRATRMRRIGPAAATATGDPVTVKALREREPTPPRAPLRSGPQPGHQEARLPARPGAQPRRPAAMTA